MKRTCIAACLGAVVATFGWSQTTPTTWNLVSYIEAYVEASSSIDEQIERIDDAESNLTTARIRKEARLSIHELELELEVARRKLREVENGVAADALALYLSFINATESASAARASYELSHDEYTVMRNRFDAEEASERELLNKQVALLQAEKALASAEYQQTNARNRLTRPLDIAEDVEIATRVPHPSADTEVPLDLDTLKEASSTYYRHTRTAELKEAELAAKSSSDVFTPVEIEELEDALEASRDALQSTVWGLEDEMAGVERDLAGVRADIEIAELRRSLDRTELDSKRLQYEFGEVLKTDLTSARNSYEQSVTEVESAYRKLLEIVLTAAALRGERMVDTLSTIAATAE